MRSKRCTIRIRILAFFICLSVLPRVSSAGDLPERTTIDASHLLATAREFGAFDRSERYLVNDRPRKHVPHFTSAVSFFTPQSQISSNAEQSVLHEWHEYVGGKLERYRTLSSPDLTFCAQSECNPDSIDRSVDKLWMKKTVLKETANFVRKREPWINTIIRLTTLQIRHNTNNDVTLRSVKDPGPLDPSAVAPRKKHKEFSFKAGIKTNFIEGQIGFVAEAQARYRKLTTFYRLDMSKQINIIGMEYPLAGGMLVQYRHTNNYVASAADGFGVDGGGAFQSLMLIRQF